MKTVLITGGTGLIGSTLRSLLKKKGYNYRLLSTRKKLSNTSDNTFYWNPANGEIDAAAFDDVDVIVHLAGSTVNQPWTKSGKESILQSRLQSTNLLKESLTSVKKIPLIITASATGIYPDLGDEWVDEDQTPDDDFLADVVVKWEKATLELSAYCDRLVTMRIGVVLSSRGGAFPLMAKATKYWVGSPFGKGDQYMSWIHATDVAEFIYFSINNEHVSGVYNTVAANPETNGDFMMELATAMDKPFFLPNIPQFLLKLVLGERANILLKGVRASNQKIASTGFEYRFPHIQKVFNHSKV